MKKYRVWFTGFVEVEADNKSDAVTKAKDIVPDSVEVDETEEIND